VPLLRCSLAMMISVASQVKGSFPKWLWTRIGKFWDGHPKLQRNPQVYGYGQSFTFRAHADVMLFVGYINGGGLPLRWTIVDSRTGRITTYP